MKKFTLNDFVYDKQINEFNRNGTTLITFEGKSVKSINGVHKINYITLTKEQFNKYQNKKAEKVKKVQRQNKYANNQFKNVTKDDTLNKGKWIVSFDIKITVVRSKGQNYVYDDFISEKYVTSKDIPVSKAVNKLIDKHTDEYYAYASNFEIDVKNIKVAPFVKADLKDAKMKQTKLAYDLLGNVNEINKNDGQCVLDYILYECSKVAGLKKVNRQSLIKFFGEDCITNGISTNQIINWAKHMENVTVHALNPFMNQFASHTATKSNYASLCFIVNNNHCYPIVDTAMKKSIAENKSLEVSKLVFKVLYDDYEYVGKAITPELIKGTATTKKVVLVETMNLIDLIQKIGAQCNEIVYNMKFNKSKVVMFEHPISKQIYVATDDFEARKKVSEDMKNMTNIHDFTFSNDSFTELSKKYFSAKFGNIKKSDYSPDYMNIIDNFKLGPYNAKVHQPSESSDVYGYDIKGAYRSILVKNDTPYNIFYVHSRITPFNQDDELIAGEYYVNRMIKFGHNQTIRLSSGFYPLVLIKYLLEQGYISKSDITCKITASHTLPADTFKAFTEDVCNKWDKESKSLINNFIGDMNTMTKKVSKGCVTDSLDIAVGTFFCELDKGQDPAIFHVNDLYFLRVDYSTKLSSGHIPIWRHIIASGYILLDKLCKAVCLPHSTICHYKTDCISVINPKEYSEIFKNNNQVPQNGDIRSEAIVKICGRPLSEIENKPEFKYQAPKWIELVENQNNYNDIVQFAKNHSCMVIGQGGSGKTELIKNINDDKSIVFVVSNKACDNLRLRGVKNSHIFDSYFIDYIHNNGMIPDMSNYNNVIVDEFFTVSTTYMKILVLINRLYPNIKFKFFGDSKQTPAIESDNPECDLSISPTVMKLCSNNRITLLYKFTRYDKSLYDVVMYFDQFNKLPKTCENKTVQECWINLCYTNEKRNEINRIMFQKFIQDKEVIKYNDVDICIGLPVISLFNSPTKGLFNSRIFTIIDITDEGVKLSDNVFVPKKLFTFKPSKKDGKAKFDYAFCMTVHKFQGSEIKEDFCIYEIEKMDKRLLNTALTRGQTLDKVHFNYTNKYFRIRKLNENPIESKIYAPQHKTGRIYIIKNDKGQAYVGSTEKEITERFEEHKIESVNKNMDKFMKSKVNIELVQEIKFTNKRTLLTLEDHYITHFNEQYELMNVKINIKNKDKKGITKKQIVVEQKSYLANKFPIDCLETQHSYRIRWTHEGERMTKVAKWSKKVTKEQAYEKIKLVQLELIKLYS